MAFGRFALELRLELPDEDGDRLPVALARPPERSERLLVGRPEAPGDLGQRRTHVLAGELPPQLLHFLPHRSGEIVLWHGPLVLPLP